MDLPKADELTLMSTELHRLFRAGGCDPTCHCCGIRISVGRYFKLGHVSEDLAIRASHMLGGQVFKTAKEHDVMLCSEKICSPETMFVRHQQQLDLYEKEGKTPWGGYPSRSGGCSIIDGKIIP